MKTLTSRNLSALTFVAMFATSGATFAQSNSPPADDQLTANQQATQEGITTLCRDELVGNDDLTEEGVRLRDRCGEIVRQESDQTGPLNAALQDVQAEEIEILGSQATEASGNQMKHVGNRMAALRAGAGSTIADGNWSGAVPTGGMASSDDFSRLGFFVNADYASGDRDESANVDGFEFDTSGITVGGDYRFGDNFVAGIAYHYLDSEAEIDRGFGQLDTEGQTLTLYGTAYSDNFYVDASIGAGEFEYDSLRVVDYHTDATFHENLSAAPDGDQLTWSLGAGFTANSGAVNMNYYGRVNAINLEIDGYTEITDNVANGAMAMTVSDQEIDSLQSELGAQFSYAISQDFGVILPYVDVAWIHEYEDGDDAIISRYTNGDGQQGVNNVSFSTATDEFDADYFRLSLGASMGLSGGVQMFVNYETLLDLENYSYDAITAGIRLEL